MDTETINELKQKYIDTADELTQGGRRRPTRKNPRNPPNAFMFVHIGLAVNGMLPLPSLTETVDANK